MGLRILFKNKVKTGKKIIQLGTKFMHWLLFPYNYNNNGRLPKQWKATYLKRAVMLLEVSIGECVVAVS